MIKVIKKFHGGILTRALTLANLTNALNSGDYPVQMMSGVSDGASAVGFSLDTINALTTTGARNFKILDNGTELFAVGKYNSESYGGTGVDIAGHVAIGESASVSDKSLLVIEGTMDLSTFGDTGSAMELTPILNISGAIIEASAFTMNAQVDGAGVLPFIAGIRATVTQNSSGGWGANPGLKSPSVIEGQYKSLPGSASMGNWVSVFQAKAPDLQGGVPVSYTAFESHGALGVATTYGFYDWGSTYALWSRSGGIVLDKDGSGASPYSGSLVLGEGQDVSFSYGGVNTELVNLVGTGAFNPQMNLIIGAGAAGVDYILAFNGETNDGFIFWMEDEDYFQFVDDILMSPTENIYFRDTAISIGSLTDGHLDLTADVSIDMNAPLTLFGNGEFPVLDKASGNGIKVDTTTPTFGFADMLGDQFSKNTGATKPTLATYNGVVQAWQFGDGDEAFMSFHIPHDYVKGTDIHLHIHWSQTSTTATGGTLDFKYTGIYAKGHNQASGSTFTSTPIIGTFSSININDGSSGLNQYQHHLTEIIISGASATAALFDRDDFEPDGVIELTFEMDANNLTNSVTVLDPFIHFVDIHYNTTSIIGTKSKSPDFYV